MIQKYLSSAKNILTYFSASIIPMLLNLIANPFISMNMSPEDFAISGYYTSFANLLTPLMTFYFLQYYIKRYYEVEGTERQKLKAAIVKLLLTFSIAVAILSILALYAYIKVFNSDIHFDIFPYLPIAIMAMPLTGLYNLELAEYKMQRNSSSFFWLSTINGVINSGSLVVLIVFLHLGALGKLLSPLLVNVAFTGYLIYKYRQLLFIKVDRGFIMKMFKFCWPLATAAMLGYFTNGYDKTCLERVGENDTFGYYVVAASMAALLTVFSNAIGNTFQPDVYQCIAEKNRRKLMKIFGVQLAMLLAIVLVFEFACPLIVYVLTAGRYMESIPFTRILCIGTFTSAMYFNINCYTIGSGHPKLSLYTSILGSIALILLMPLCIDYWKFNGAAWLSVCSYLIFFMFNALLLIVKSHRNEGTNNLD